MDWLKWPRKGMKVRAINIPRHVGGLARKRWEEQHAIVLTVRATWGTKGHVMTIRWEDGVVSNTYASNFAPFNNED